MHLQYLCVCIRIYFSCIKSEIIDRIYTREIETLARTAICIVCLGAQKPSHKILSQSMSRRGNRFLVNLNSVIFGLSIINNLSPRRKESDAWTMTSSSWVRIYEYIEEILKKYIKKMDSQSAMYIFKVREYFFLM